jgi:hypothetical protein
MSERSEGSEMRTGRLKAVQRTLEQTDALDLVLAFGALDESPGVVEFRLYGYMAGLDFLEILLSQYLLPAEIRLEGVEDVNGRRASSSSKERDTSASAAYGMSVVMVAEIKSDKNQGSQK